MGTKKRAAEAAFEVVRCYPHGRNAFYGKAVWHIGNNPQERARQRLRVVVCSLAIAPLRFAMTLSRPSRQACSNITARRRRGVRNRVGTLPPIASGTCAQQFEARATHLNDRDG
jgi:hypothetical protein